MNASRETTIDWEESENKGLVNRIFDPIIHNVKSKEPEFSLERDFQNRQTSVSYVPSPPSSYVQSPSKETPSDPPALHSNNEQTLQTKTEQHVEKILFNVNTRLFRENVQEPFFKKK